jgi:hypothetical protein
MDERNSHTQDNGNHCLHQEDNQWVTWQTQKPFPLQGVERDKRRKIQTCNLPQ